MTISRHRIEAARRCSGYGRRVARGERDRPVGAWFYDPPNFLIEFDAAGSISGRLAEDGSKLDVVYKFGDFVIPFALDRVDPSRFPPAPKVVYTPGTTSTEKLCGFWNGKIEWKGHQLRQVVHLGRAADGTVYGKMDLLDQGERNLPLTGITLTNDMVRFECKPWQMVYSGRLSQDGDTLRMEFNSGTKSAPVTFQRGAEPWHLEVREPVGSAGSGSSDLTGTWQGLLDMQSTCSRLELRMVRTVDGGYQVTQFSPDDPGAFPSPAVRTEFKDGHLTCEWLGADFTRAVLQVRQHSATKELTGAMEAWGMLSPVSLHRVEAPTLRSAR